MPWADVSPAAGGALAGHERNGADLLPGGVLAFAYINKLGVMYHAIVNGWCNKALPFWKRFRQNYYPNRKGNHSIFAGVNDINTPFFFTMPGEMGALAAQCGLQAIQNAGVDMTFTSCRINTMDDCNGPAIWSWRKRCCNIPPAPHGKSWPDDLQERLIAYVPRRNSYSSIGASIGLLCLTADYSPFKGMN